MYSWRGWALWTCSIIQYAGLNSPGFCGPHSRLVDRCILQMKALEEIVSIFVMLPAVFVSQVGCELTKAVVAMA